MGQKLLSRCRFKAELDIEAHDDTFNSSSMKDNDDDADSLADFLVYSNEVAAKR